MDWLTQLFTAESVAQSVLLLSLVIALGLALGSVRIKGVSLGIAGVLFSGLLFGHFGFHLEHNVMEFAREFGLILFVFMIGIQVGPGFFASLRHQGLPLNLMAFSIVTLGALITVALVKVAGLAAPVAVGLLSGGTTNTPSLAAAQQALKEIPGVTEEISKLPGLGYAVAYPFGIRGILLVMGLVRAIFRINLKVENGAIESQSRTAGLHTLNLLLTNRNLDGLPLREVAALLDPSVVISRVMHAGATQVAQPDTVVHTGDVVLAVGPAEPLERARLVVGELTDTDLRKVPSNITTRRIVVTKEKALGQSVEELELAERFGVTITRINRAEVDLPAAQTKLQFGDVVLAVGEEAAIQRAAKELGDSVKKLNHPQVIPIFVGIAIGVLIGSMPLHIPGIPAPVKLGLAGGPLLAAIILSRIGNIGPLVWYTPHSANFMLREVGVTLFLACVGLKSGDQFVNTLMQGDGLMWMGYAALITAVPLLIVGFIARAVFKLNYVMLCGLLAGSMTDPPALAFATNMAGSNAPSVAYATVYPLTMLLRVVYAQVLVLLLAGY